MEQVAALKRAMERLPGFENCLSPPSSFLTLDLWICLPLPIPVRADLLALIRRFNIYGMFSMLINFLSMTLGLKYFQRTWRTQLYFFHMTNIFPDLLGAEAAFQTNFPWGGGLKAVGREVLTCVHCHPVSSLAVLVSSLCPPPNPSSAESAFKGHIGASQSPQKLSVVEWPTNKANSWTRCCSSSFELPSTSSPAPSLTIPSLSALKVQAALGCRHWTSMVQAAHMTSLHWTNHILFCIYCSAPFTSKLSCS